MRSLFPYLFCLAWLLSIGRTAYPQLNTATLILEVVDYQTSWPIQQATVAVVDTELRTQTTTEGVAQLAGIPEGIHLISVEHSRFTSEVISLTFGPGAILEATLALERAPIEMEGIEIVDERIDPSLERRGYYRRKASGVGKYIEREELEERGKVLLSDALRGVAGVRIVTLDGQKVAVTMRRGSPCPMRVFIDGSRLSSGSAGPPQSDAVDLNMWALNEVAAIEVYTGLSQIPIQYSQYNRCGAVLIWTRVGE